jgi:hypothetical protein
MTINTDAKTQKNSRRNSNSFYPDTSQGLGRTEVAGGGNGAYENRFNSDDCSEENIAQPSDGGNVSTGKILTRLKQLESEYLSYVSEHQERLETRLEESKRREAGFKRSVRQLEQDIQQLMSGKD